MNVQEQTQLLDEVRAAAAGIDAAREAARLAAEQSAAEARRRRAEAIRACEAAGIARERIAAAAGLKWPLTRQRWSVLRRV